MGKVFLYQKVHDSILNGIRDGDFEEGKKIPDDKELCEQYGVSMITLNKALCLLAEEGYVKRIPGNGTFVNKWIKAEKKVAKNEKMIGVILEHISSPFGLEMMYQMDLFAMRAGYRILVRFSYGEREQETKEINFLLSLGVEGLIIMPSHGKHYNQAILRLCLNGFPVVLVDKKMKGIPVPSVRTDNRAAAATLVRALAEEGNRRIAFISTDDQKADSVKERRNGFIGEMEKLRLEEAGICAVSSGITREEYMNHNPNSKVVYEIRKFLEQNKGEMDAVIVSEYGIVPEVVQAMKLEEIKPEEEIRIACVDEDYMAPEGTRFMHVKQDEKEIAKKALNILFSQISGNGAEEDDILIPGIFCRSCSFYS